MFWAKQNLGESKTHLGVTTPKRPLVTMGLLPPTGQQQLIVTRTIQFWCFFTQLVCGYFCFVFAVVRIVFGYFRFEQSGNSVELPSLAQVITNAGRNSSPVGNHCCRPCITRVQLRGWVKRGNCPGTPLQ